MLNSYLQKNFHTLFSGENTLDKSLSINECITDFPKVISLIFAGKLICNYIS